MRCGLTQHQALAVILVLQLVFVIMNTTMFPAVHLTYVVVADVALYTVFHLVVNAVIYKKSKLSAAQQ